MQRLILAAMIAACGFLSACDGHRHHGPGPTGHAGECKGHLPFDFVYAARDANGLPLNPEWDWQCAFKHDGSPRVAEYRDPHALCQGFTYSGEDIVIGPDCSNEISELDVPDATVPQWYFICHVHEAPPWLPLEPDSYVHGHVDWQPVTVTGRLTFESPGGALSDQDTNLSLLPAAPSLAEADARSTPLATPANLVVSASGEESAPLHLEFAYPEVEPALGEASGWWKSRLAKLTDSQASVTGLLALDNRHDSKAELHPVFALAAREPGGGTPDEPWAVLWRNTGDQGGCSSHDPLRHRLITQGNVLTLEVPSPFTKARSVRLVDTNLWREGKRLAPGAGPSLTLSRDHTRARLSVRLGDPSSEPAVAGEVSLAWLPAPGAVLRSTPLSGALPLLRAPAPGGEEGLHDADKLLLRLRRRLSASKLHMLANMLHGEAALDARHRTCAIISPSRTPSLRSDLSAVELVEAVLDCSGRRTARVPLVSAKHALVRPHVIARTLHN